MKAMLSLGVAMLITGSVAQQAGTKRTPLQQHDLSAPGREVIQVRVDFDPGYVSPRHTHFGEEIIYVLEGTLEYQTKEVLHARYTASSQERRRDRHRRRALPARCVGPDGEGCQRDDRAGRTRQ